MHNVVMTLPPPPAPKHNNNKQAADYRIDSKVGNFTSVAHNIQLPHTQWHQNNWVPFFENTENPASSNCAAGWHSLHSGAQTRQLTQAATDRFTDLPFVITGPNPANTQHTHSAQTPPSPPPPSPALSPQ